jgi:lysophospholipase L1-like esterase
VRRLLSLLGAVLLCVLLLVVLEGVLRLLGVGDPPEGLGSRLRYQQVFLPVLEPGALPDGTEVLHSTDARLPYAWVAREKPAGALRVFCFGGSATAGLGFSPNVTFPRYLERMLREAEPEREVEVVNLGMVALPSAGVRLLVKDVCARYEPDLLVVYSGNNEFLELHSQRYFDATASLAARVQNRLGSTNLFRLVKGGSSERPRITSRDIARAAGQRVTHREMMREVRIDDEDRAALFAAYRENLEDMAAAADEAGCPLVLCTVASNWQWWGMEDLTGEVSLAELEERLPSADPTDRHELLYRRAALSAEAGDWSAARADYRAAMNADPHLRRAVDSFADEVRAVCAATDAHLLDVVELLSEAAEHRVIGFDEFYDYVHFTPRGALLVAGGIARELERLGLVPAAALDPEEFAARELAALEDLEQDHIDVSRFLGVGGRPEALADRDLWKYDRLWDELDARLTAEPADWRSRTWRGNLHFFRPEGFAEARADYEAALAVVDDPDVRENLRKLLTTRRP